MANAGSTFGATHFSTLAQLKAAMDNTEEGEYLQSCWVAKKILENLDTKEDDLVRHDGKAFVFSILDATFTSHLQVNRGDEFSIDPPPKF